MHINVGGIQVPMTEQISNRLGLHVLAVKARSEGVPQSMGTAPAPWKSASPVGTVERLFDHTSCQRLSASAPMPNEQLRCSGKRSPSSSILSHCNQDVPGNRQLSAAIRLQLRYDHTALTPINLVDL
jgi:hypothetical protein